jgi:hypothetical protein
VLKDLWRENRRLVMAALVVLWVVGIVAVYFATQDREPEYAGTGPAPIRALEVGALPVT